MPAVSRMEQVQSRGSSGKRDGQKSSQRTLLNQAIRLWLNSPGCVHKTDRRLLETDCLVEHICRCNWDRIVLRYRCPGDQSVHKGRHCTRCSIREGMNRTCLRRIYRSNKNIHIVRIREEKNGNIRTIACNPARVRIYR